MLLQAPNQLAVAGSDLQVRVTSRLPTDPRWREGCRRCCAACLYAKHEVLLLCSLLMLQAALVHRCTPPQSEPVMHCMRGMRPAGAHWQPTLAGSASPPVQAPPPGHTRRGGTDALGSVVPQTQGLAPGSSSESDDGICMVGLSTVKRQPHR